jgi:serine/threonine protein kinase
MNPVEKHSKTSAFDSAHAQSGDVKIEDDDRIYVTEGDVIANKYVVERVLGVGGIGFVVAARHQELGGYFALKFLKRRFLRQPQVVERFTREARAACRIQSEYVARVYDVGASDGIPFLVMEYLVGRDLAKVLAEDGRLSVDDAVEFTVHACVALAVAHAHGIVHRDIKPENLFLVEHDGLSTIKLLDFGISKVTLSDNVFGSASSKLTGSLALGTPFYMSPEQIRATASADARSDLWSLGVVFYEMLTATVAFGGGSVTEICASILERQPAALSALRPEMPAGLVEVVNRCIEKDPANRFRNVSDLAVALLPFAPLRVLAVAEGSSSIRRAAIHAIGGGAETLGPPTSRTSGYLRIAGSLPPHEESLPPSTRSQRQSLPGDPAPARGITRQRLVGVLVAVGVIVFAAAIGVLVHRPVGAGVQVAAGAPPVMEAVNADPVPSPASAPAPAADERPEPAIPATSEAPRAGARPVRGPPIYRAAPAAAPPRAAAASSRPGVTTKSAGSVVEPVATPPAPPSSVRARPDVGY